MLTVSGRCCSSGRMSTPMQMAAPWTRLPLRHVSTAPARPPQPTMQRCPPLQNMVLLPTAQGEPHTPSQAHRGSPRSASKLVIGMHGMTHARGMPELPAATALSSCKEGLQCDPKVMQGGHLCTAQGFSSIYKLKRGGAVLFADLLDSVARACPEMRIRYTSPHPKDFGDDVLQARTAFCMCKGRLT